MLSFFFSEQEPGDSGMEMTDRTQKGESSFPVTPELSLAMQSTCAGVAKSLSLPLSSTATTANYEEDFSLLYGIVHGSTDTVSQQPEHISGMSGMAQMDQSNQLNYMCIHVYELIKMEHKNVNYIFPWLIDLPLFSGIGNDSVATMGTEHDIQPEIFDIDDGISYDIQEDVRRMLEEFAGEYNRIGLSRQGWLD